MRFVLRCLVWLALAAASCPAAAQTNSTGGVETNVNYRLVLVTNWAYPWNGLRTVGGQLYDINYSELWSWITIPQGATVQDARYYGYDQPTDLTFTLNGRDERDVHTIIVYNFPYDPGDFRHAEGERGLVATAFPINLRVFTVNIQTNWSPLGRSWISTRTYDYGVPYTNMVPMTSWARVPANQATNQAGPVASAAPSEQPKTISVSPYQITFGDTLSNRFQLATNIANLPQKDLMLGLLAMRAQQEGDIKTVKACLQNMASESLRDTTAGNIAQTLYKNGDPTDASDITYLITNPRIRQMMLKTLNQ